MHNESNVIPILVTVQCYGMLTFREFLPLHRKPTYDFVGHSITTPNLQCCCETCYNYASLLFTYKSSKGIYIHFFKDRFNCSGWLFLSVMCLSNDGQVVTDQFGLRPMNNFPTFLTRLIRLSKLHSLHSCFHTTGKFLSRDPYRPTAVGAKFPQPLFPKTTPFSTLQTSITF